MKYRHRVKYLHLLHDITVACLSSLVHCTCIGGAARKNLCSLQINQYRRMIGGVLVACHVAVLHVECIVPKTIQLGNCSTTCLLQSSLGYSNKRNRTIEKLVTTFPKVVD